VNTTIDLLALNSLLWLWPAQGAARLLLFNTLAYACGALNSFVFNRYWPTGYATRYEQASRKGEGCPFDLLSGRREEEVTEGKRATKIDRI
jgi:hypothetical protein